MSRSRQSARVLLTILCAALFVLQSQADEPSGLKIRSDIDSAIVVIDGDIAGKTPLGIEDLRPGPHAIRLVHPDLENWLSPVILDSVDLLPGEIRDLQYRFNRALLVRSDPSGAEVVINQRVAGTTPFMFVSVEPDSLMEVRKQGFAVARVNPALAERGVVHINLDPDPNQETGVPSLSGEPERPSSLPIILSGASSILAGGFSAYFKIQADQVHREYLLTGDPSKLAETRKLDNVAGIALGASQIYLALFSYLMLTR